MPKYNPEFHQVKVQYWGLKNIKSKGLGAFLKGLLFGGNNAGHASLVMSLPVDHETKRWIEENCYSQTFEQYKQSNPKADYRQYLEDPRIKIIPTTLKTNTTYLAKQSSEGTFKKTDKVASVTEYFQIEFSWRNTLGKPFILVDTEIDMQEEQGQHFEYSDAAKEYLQPEERRHAGMLGNQVMIHAPYSFVHQRDLSDTQMEIINTLLRLDRVEEHLRLKEKLLKKINDMKSPKIEGSLKFICKNIGLDCDALVTNYLENNPGKVKIKHFKKFFQDEVEKYMLQQLEAEKIALKEIIGTWDIKRQKLEEILDKPQNTDFELQLLLEKVNTLLKNKEPLLQEIRDMETITPSLRLKLKEIGVEYREIEELHSISRQRDDINHLKNLLLPSVEFRMNKLRIEKRTLEIKLETKLKCLHVEQLQSQLEEINKQLEGDSEEDIINKLLEKKELETKLEILHVEQLRLEEELASVNKVFYQEYRTLGIPPNHVVTLPYESEGRAGLSPEAMLKKMRQLTEKKAGGYNFLTKNCATTTTEILAAGAEHNPLLKATLHERILGIFCTPQQVIENAKVANDIIFKDKKNTLLTRIGNINLLNKVMGKLISVVIDSEAYKLQKVLAFTALFPVTVLKIPGATIRALLEPTAKMENIIDIFTTVVKQANSIILKGLAGIICAPLLAILAPFAAVEQGLSQIAKLANKASKNESPPSLKSQITLPLPSAKEKEPNREPSYCTMMAKLVNAKVARKVTDNLKELTSQNKLPLEILDDFEAALKDNSDKVIILSDRDFDTINQYVREENNPQLTKRFQNCCNQSLFRANQLSPKTPKEVDMLVEEIQMRAPML